MLIETSAGDLVVDLFTDDTPIAAKNFLKLCKVKYYHACLFFNVQPNFIAQCGDPTGTGKGGTSAYGLMYGSQAETFEDEIRKGEGARKHDKLGLLSMANTGPNSNRSQFFITMRAEDLEHLDGKHTIFGEVAEGFDVLDTINNLFCDEDGRPFQDVRIKHTHILDDPFDDPPQLEIPPASPSREYPEEERVGKRVPFEESLETVQGERTEAELEQSIKRKEAHSRAIVLEMTGDIPDAEVKPPEEVLFVCKLNPVTTDDDLEILFSRFGKIRKCEIIRDTKTGDSLNYAFIEFETEDACIEAYEKMNNVLIDDRRIKVDFSQSVSKLWNKYAMKPMKQHRPKNKDRDAPFDNGRMDRRMYLQPSREQYKPDSDNNRQHDDRHDRHRRHEKKLNRSRSRDRVRRRRSRSRSTSRSRRMYVDEERRSRHAYHGDERERRSKHSRHGDHRQRHSDK